MAKSRTPDFNLKVLDKTTSEAGKIGVGWQNEDGSITIVLNHKVYLAQNRNEVITLFPKDDIPYAPQPKTL